MMTSLMVISLSSAKTVLILSFDFGFTGPELSLLEIWESTAFPHTLLKVCSAHEDKVEIKCMGSIGGKHQHNQNFIYSSLALGTLDHDKC